MCGAPSSWPDGGALVAAVQIKRWSRVCGTRTASLALQERAFFLEQGTALVRPSPAGPPLLAGAVVTSRPSDRAAAAGSLPRPRLLLPPVVLIFRSSQVVMTVPCSTSGSMLGGSAGEGKRRRP